MKPETIRIIDIWVGRLICLALTLLRRLLDKFSRQGNGLPVRKILFIKLIEQGATVLAYGALTRAITRVGRENVYICVFAENRAIVDILELIPPENIFSIRHDTFLLFLRDIAGLLIRCRSLGIDATVDMEFFARASAILAFLTGAKRRVGLHRFTSEAPYRGDLMTHRVHYNPYLHTAKAYALLVEALDADPGDIPLVKTKTETVIAEAPIFVPTAAERASMERRLAEEFHCPAGALRILLNPNASDMLPLRKWDAERFVELGKRLLQEHPEVHLLITGAPSEAPSALEVCRQIGSERAFCVAGRTTLRELIVLYSLADVLVTNDSGPGHFASMTNIESVVMYGPETPALFGAIGGRPHTVYAALACSPCVNVFNHRFSPCTNNRCMQMISVAEIYAIVTACMRRTRQE